MKPSASVVAQHCHAEGPEAKSFRERNSVKNSYRGPVFVVEDVWVACARCGAVVDPVVRVPVHNRYYHPDCVRCVVCGRKERNGVYYPVHEEPVCKDCMTRGYDRQVPSTRAHRSVPRSAPRSITGFPGTALSPQALIHDVSPQRVKRLIERQLAASAVDSNILTSPPPPSPKKPSSAAPTIESQTRPQLPPPPSAPLVALGSGTRLQ